MSAIYSNIGVAFKNITVSDKQVFPFQKREKNLLKSVFLSEIKELSLFIHKTSLKLNYIGRLRNLGDVT